MSGPASGDTILLTKCLEFCQALSSQGQPFNISISTGSGFSFSLDTRSKAVNTNSQSQKKKASPSTLRRNAKRRKEFLARKQQTSPTTESSGDETASVTPKCDQCEYIAASEKGLKQHTRMKHKNTAPLQSTPEIPRSRDELQGSLDCSNSMSPLSSRREENCSNCDGTFSPVHQCEITDQGPWKEDAYLEAGLDECPECHAKRPNRCNFFEHPYVPKK